MAEKTLLPENRTVPTRLDEIRHVAQNGCRCRLCVAIRELLAVVDADRMGLTPEDMATGFRMQALTAEGEERQSLNRGAAAWDAIS